MNSKLFVGNVSHDITENDLQDMFTEFGPVTEVNLMMDRATGRPRGFAFVTMATPEGAQAAIQGLSGKSVKGRNLTVNARARSVAVEAAEAEAVEAAVMVTEAAANRAHGTECLSAVPWRCPNFEASAVKRTPGRIG